MGSGRLSAEEKHIKEEKVIARIKSAEESAGRWACGRQLGLDEE